MVTKHHQWVQGTQVSTGYWDFQLSLACSFCHAAQHLSYAQSSVPTMELVTTEEVGATGLTRVVFELRHSSGAVATTIMHTCYVQPKPVEPQDDAWRLARVEQMLCDLMSRSEDLVRLRGLVDVLRARLVMSEEELARTKAELVRTNHGYMSFLGDMARLPLELKVQLANHGFNL